MKQKIRIFILFEAVTFIIAALIHAGLLMTGYEHREACIAESLISAVLTIGLLISFVRPAWTRGTGLLIQGFAFFGTCVGVFTIMVGVGPQTVMDILYHVIILLVLGWGIAVAKESNPHQIK